MKLRNKHQNFIGTKAVSTFSENLPSTHMENNSVHTNIWKRLVYTLSSKVYM